MCSFCHPDEPVLDRLRGGYAAQLAVEWKAFELRPDPVPILGSAGEYLRTTWNQSGYRVAWQR